MDVRVFFMGKWVKLILHSCRYYVGFAGLYCLAGKAVDYIMVIILFILFFGTVLKLTPFKVNSTWTKNHIKRIWMTQHVQLVFPPCDTKELFHIPLEPRNEKIILSVAQFRYFFYPFSEYTRS